MKATARPSINGCGAIVCWATSTAPMNSGSASKLLAWAALARAR
jgi:hypothetical protein